MAFSSTVTKVENIGNGFIRETGTWNGSGVTTGTITAVDGSTDYGFGLVAITDIANSDAYSDADTQVYKALDVAPNKLKLTFASGDTGDYSIVGKAR